MANKMENAQTLSQLKELEITIGVKKREIKRIKTQFEETDYQTAKNVQYEKMGKDLPYKWTDIYDKAEKLRQAIRDLELEIASLEATKISYSK